MRRLIHNTVRFLLTDDGPTAVEYAVMLALILMACIGAIALFGQATSSSFNHSSNSIISATH